MEVKALTRDLVEPRAESAFILQYLDTVEILGRAWTCCIYPLKSCFSCVGSLEVLLVQLDRSLNELQYKFTDLTREREVHILEMIHVAYSLKMCSSHIYPKKLNSVYSRLEHLIEEGSFEPSTYVAELKKKTLEENGFSLKGCLEHYSLRQFMFSGNLVHMKAELDMSGSYEDPISCIPGLPVGIPCEISLYNISSESWVGLEMSLGEKVSEFVSLDLNGCDEKRKFTFVAPFVYNCQIKVL